MVLCRPRRPWAKHIASEFSEWDTSAVVELPSGTVTFLFTDVEGSTRLWEEHSEAMKVVLTRHDAIIDDAVRTSGVTWSTHRRRCARRVRYRGESH